MFIDLNADIGEGFGIWRLGDDEALLEVVTSANVACGFHAGDPSTLRRVCSAAAERGVVVGAQVGYRDLAGFGRRRMDIPADDLTADVLYQIGGLEACARAAGTRVAYVKPHGALYNTAADDTEQAAAVVAAMAAWDRSLPLLALPNSAMAEAAADAGIPFVAEAFADRAYQPTGRLVPRVREGAVIADHNIVVERAVDVACRQQVAAHEGTTVAVHARSLCVHGDTPGAVRMAFEIRRALEANGVELRSFATP